MENALAPLELGYTATSSDLCKFIDKLGLIIIRVKLTRKLIFYSFSDSLMPLTGQ